MTYKEKKSLYESIMKEVAKTVKRNINESESSFDDIAHIVNIRTKALIEALRTSNKSAIKPAIDIIDDLKNVLLKGADADFLRDISQLLKIYQSGNKTIEGDFAGFITDYKI